MKTVTSWKSGHEFVSQDGHGESPGEHHKIRMDGSRRNAFSPKTLLLAGLGGCSGVDVVDILKKMRVKFSELVIETETEQTEEHPKVFKEIQITYRVRTAKENEDKVRKAIDLSLKKYCGVAAMLKKNSRIHSHLLIEPDKSL